MSSKESPCPFIDQEVRAILDGTKTQTRRIIKMPAPEPYAVMGEADDGTPWPFVMDEAGQYHAMRCPFGQPGDRLWVRETWALVPWLAGAERHCCPEHDKQGIRYRATWTKAHSAAWRPSSNMPRWASRLTLRVAGVRVERLQDISEADAQAEGVPLVVPGDDIEARQPGVTTHRFAFGRLWQQINGKRATWASNPSVWAIEFRRMS